MSYCKYCNQLPKENLHRIYHDTEYGMKPSTDDALFGRLILEINQAGLSWNTILNKSNSIKAAYFDFEIQKIAQLENEDIDALMQNAGIIRHRGKINAIVYNAKIIIEIQEENGSFDQWLTKNAQNTLDESLKVFKKKFKFVGKEIVKEFLMNTGYLSGAHDLDCPLFLN
ncbi:MAG: DNA-3-methyladenine glycosylase I [Crocinitomicaceae bacterium]